MTPVSHKQHPNNIEDQQYQWKMQEHGMHAAGHLQPGWNDQPAFKQQKEYQQAVECKATIE